MNNITFPEMDSATSVSDTVLNTLDQNLNIFKVHPVAPAQLSLPALVQQPVQIPTQPQVSMQLPSKPVSRPPPQSQPQSQPQQNRSVSFNNNVQQKVIPAIKRNGGQQNPAPSPAPVVQPPVPTTTQIVPQNNSDQIIQKDSETKSESKESALSKFNIGGEILKVGKFSLPKKTLLLLGIILVVGGVLFYVTKPKTNKKKKEEDEEETK
jgi:hypothetical protein